MPPGAFGCARAKPAGIVLEPSRSMDRSGARRRTSLTVPPRRPRSSRAEWAGDGQLQRRAIQPSPQPSGGVVGIVDYAESLVVEYKYNPWGKPTLVRTLTDT